MMEEGFDAICRALASPMSRRKVLKLTVTTLAGSALTLFSVGKASASGPNVGSKGGINAEPLRHDSCDYLDKPNDKPPLVWKPVGTTGGGGPVCCPMGYLHVCEWLPAGGEGKTPDCCKATVDCCSRGQIGVFTLPGCCPDANPACCDGQQATNPFAVKGTCCNRGDVCCGACCCNGTDVCLGDTA